MSLKASAPFYDLLKYLVCNSFPWDLSAQSGESHLKSSARAHVKCLSLEE